MIAYFDTNVYFHLTRSQHGLGPQHLKKLVNAVNSGNISLAFSFLDIEEAGCAGGGFPKAVIENMLRLMDGSRVVREHAQILQRDIVAYCERKPPPNNFLRINAENRGSCFSMMAENDSSLWEPIRKELRNKKNTWFAEMVNAKRSTMPAVRQFNSENKGKRPKFEDYYKATSQAWAEATAEAFGLLERCRQRGTEGLLETRSLRFFVGYTTSLLFAQQFEKHEPDDSDMNDQVQVITCSAANVFVSHDKKLCNHVSRIPQGIKLYRRLQDFLDTI